MRALYLLYLLPAVSQATCLFGDYEASYQLTAGPAKGTIQQTLAFPDSHHYLLQSVTQAHVLFFGDTITETSHGANLMNLVKPDSYQLSDTKNNTSYLLHFYPTYVVASYQGDTDTLAVNSVVQDGLSYQLQLRRDLLTQHTPLTYAVVTANADHKTTTELYDFTVVSTQAKIKTSLETFSTVEVKHADPTNKTQLLYWFAPQYHDLLVQSETIGADGKITALATLTDYRLGNSAYCIAQQE